MDEKLPRRDMILTAAYMLEAVKNKENEPIFSSDISDIFDIDHGTVTYNIIRNERMLFRIIRRKPVIMIALTDFTKDLGSVMVRIYGPVLLKRAWRRMEFLKNEVLQDLEVRERKEDRLSLARGVCNYWRKLVE